MTIIDNVRLPEEVEQGAQGGPQFYTSILRLASGAESRNANWINQKCVYDISYGIQYKEDYGVVRDFFYARRGRFRGFRFKDWSDFEGFSEPMTGTADGTNRIFGIVRNYVSGAIAYQRPITQIVDGTLVISKNGVMVPTTDYVVASGQVTFNVGHTPAAASVLTATFEFDVPVRFDSDSFTVHVDNFKSGTIPSIKLVELLL